MFNVMGVVGGGGVVNKKSIVLYRKGRSSDWYRKMYFFIAQSQFFGEKERMKGGGKEGRNHAGDGC